MSLKGKSRTVTASAADETQRKNPVSERLLEAGGKGFFSLDHGNLELIIAF
jgi:hypothetical protein